MPRKCQGFFKKNVGFYVVTDKVMKLTTYKILGIGKKCATIPMGGNYLFLFKSLFSLIINVSALNLFNSLKNLLLLILWQIIFVFLCPQ